MACPGCILIRTATRRNKSDDVIRRGEVALGEGEGEEEENRADYQAAAGAASGAGTKAKQQEIETTHGLLAANLIKGCREHDPNFKWTAALVDKAVNELNQAADGVPDGKIGSWKKEVIKNIILYVPEEAAAILHAAYSRIGWERSFMNEDLLRAAHWREGKTLKAAPEWKTVYTTTKKTVTAFAALLTKYWDTLWEDDVALLEAPLPEVERRKPSKTDDADITDMKTSMVLLHMVHFFHNWLEPAVANSYGASGTSKLAAMWAEFSPQFQNDLKFAVKLKDRGSTHGELTLKQLPWVYPKLAGLTEEQSIQQQVQDSRQTTLDAWEAWHKSWATTVKTFAKVVAVREQDANKRLAHDLEQATKDDVQADSFAKAFMEARFTIAPLSDLHSLSKNTASQHELAMEGAGPLMPGSGGPPNVPTIVVWDLNAVREVEPTPELTAFKEILNSRPAYAVGLVIHRQTSISTMCKREFNEQVSRKLRSLGLNLDNDFCFALKGAQNDNHNNSRPAIVTSWLVCPPHEVGTSVWDWSVIMKGVISEIPPHVPRDCRQPSCNQHGERVMKSVGFVHKSAYSMLLETVFGKSADWLRASGMAAPKRENGQPIVAVVGINPWGFNLGDAMLEFQTKNSGATAGAHLVATIATRDPDSEVHGDITRQLRDAWRAGQLSLPGHGRPGRSIYVPENPEALTLQHEISLVSPEGILKPKMSTLERFQSHPATSLKVQAFLEQEENDQQTRPKWPASAAASAHGSAALPRMPQPQESPSLAATFSTAAELLNAPKRAQARVSDGSLVFYVTADGQGWCHALKDVTVTAGVKMLGWGNAKNLDDDQTAAKQGHSKVKMTLATDEAIVFYKKEGCNETRYTLHGLLAQLQLDGKGKCKVKNHSVTEPSTGAAPAGRFTVTSTTPKHHVCSEPMSGGEEATALRPFSLMRYVQWDTVNAQYFSLAFDVKVEAVGSQWWVVLERPALVWTQTKSFRKDFIFRWA